jgi:hypothetical protein
MKQAYWILGWIFRNLCWSELFSQCFSGLIMRWWWYLGWWHHAATYTLLWKLSLKLLLLTNYMLGRLNIMNRWIVFFLNKFESPLLNNSFLWLKRCHLLLFVIWEWRDFTIVTWGDLIHATTCNYISFSFLLLNWVVIDLFYWLLLLFKYLQLL